SSGRRRDDWGGYNNTDDQDCRSCNTCGYFERRHRRLRGEITLSTYACDLLFAIVSNGSLFARNSARTTKVTRSPKVWAAFAFAMAKRTFWRTISPGSFIPPTNRTALETIQCSSSTSC